MLPVTDRFCSEECFFFSFSPFPAGADPGISCRARRVWFRHLLQARLRRRSNGHSRPTGCPARVGASDPELQRGRKYECAEDVAPSDKAYDVVMLVEKRHRADAIFEHGPGDLPD